MLVVLVSAAVAVFVCVCDREVHTRHFNIFISFIYSPDSSKKCSKADEDIERWWSVITQHKTTATHPRLIFVLL